MIETEFCTYKESMLLRKLGYNEWCDTFYEDMVTHDGKEISYEEELDLKSEGKAMEIKRKHGGNVGQHYNQNSDFLRSNLCSRPLLSQALRWLREIHFWHIESYPSTDGWHVWIVYIKEPNPEDGKLDACDFDGEVFPKYEAALHRALLFQLQCLMRAQRFLEKKIKEELKNGERKCNK